MKSILCISLAAIFSMAALCAPAGADPDFGPNVLVFDPSMKDIQARIGPIAAKQKDAQFGDARYAYLFKPGTYNVDVQVGYYVQVLGLGRTPDDVVITGNVRSNSTLPQNNVTCAFWRSVENFSYIGKDFGWALSQGTDMRRIHAHGDVSLSTHGWASGGFTADCEIDGRQDAGTQQQWFTRNSEIGSCLGGNWSMVYIGVPDAPAKWPINTSVEKTPAIAEKPVLWMDKDGKYNVTVPSLGKGCSGTDWSERWREHTRKMKLQPRNPPPKLLRQTRSHHFHRSILPRAPGEGQRRQHQCRSRRRQKPAHHPGHLSPRGQHQRHEARHGRARPRLRDVDPR